MKEFSPRNLWFIKQFYETYSDEPEFLKQLVSETPWGHNILANFRHLGRLALNMRNPPGCASAIGVGGIVATNVT